MGGGSESGGVGDEGGGGQYLFQMAHTRGRILRASLHRVPFQFLKHYSLQLLRSDLRAVKLANVFKELPLLCVVLCMNAWAVG
jgi:hypothetical protein